MILELDLLLDNMNSFHPYTNVILEFESNEMINFLIKINTANSKSMFRCLYILKEGVAFKIVTEIWVTALICSPIECSNVHVTLIILRNIKQMPQFYRRHSEK